MTPMKGIIFDLDGVLVHTDEYHYQAWKALADRLGIYFDPVINHRLRGVSRMDSLDIVLEQWKGRPFSQEEKEKLAREKNAAYRRLLQQMTPESAGQTENGDAVTVAYADGSPSQVCDIYPAEGEGAAPVIVLIHGGGFMFGDAKMPLIQPVIQAALARGYGVVSVDYRKSGEAVFPAAVADVKAAVRFVKANAAQYGFDPERIAVWGESAGAYLALMTALTPDVPELNGDVSANADMSSAVKALVSFYAPVEFYTLYEEAGAPQMAAESFESKFLGSDITADQEATYATYWETYARQLPADVKAWIQAGDSDSKVPYTQSEHFAQRLAGYLGEESVTYSLLSGADHEDEQFYTEENLTAVLDWLDGVWEG